MAKGVRGEGVIDPGRCVLLCALRPALNAAPAQTGADHRFGDSVPTWRTPRELAFKKVGLRRDRHSQTQIARNLQNRALIAIRQVDLPISTPARLKELSLRPFQTPSAGLRARRATSTTPAQSLSSPSEGWRRRRAQATRRALGHICHRCRTRPDASSGRTRATSCPAEGFGRANRSGPRSRARGPACTWRRTTAGRAPRW